MEPLVELCSAKVVCKELQQSYVGWIALVKCNDAVQANDPSADANTGAAQNT